MSKATIYAKYSLREILNRIKGLEGVRYDTDLAMALDVNKVTITQWKTRRTIPWDRLAQYAFTKEVSLDWLVLGRGTDRVADMVEKPAASAAPLEHQFLLTVTLTPVERSGT